MAIHGTCDCESRASTLTRSSANLAYWCLRNRCKSRQSKRVSERKGGRKSEAPTACSGKSDLVLAGLPGGAVLAALVKHRPAIARDVRLRDPKEMHDMRQHRHAMKLRGALVDHGTCFGSCRRRTGRRACSCTPSRRPLSSRGSQEQQRKSVAARIENKTTSRYQ